ncbi:hypothetical protein LCGC14_2143010 [marine sediment metagenome]|uniref:Uncharacterized protein n=1 Tax=marine sediment metagenome TaxID=412755 RepID=A0A0F9EK19_9ZZZZ
MAYLISKPTRREAEASRRESLAKAGLSPRRYRGTASCAEEAHDTQRQLEREGETFDKLWEVSGDSKEAREADEKLMLRQGINPETMENLNG